MQLVGRLTDRPLLAGNLIEPLVGGDAAFPAMLAAIDGATRSVSMMSYIFDNDRSGREFVEALKRAVERGVEVRVLIDAIGSRYSFPSIVGVLARAGVRVERFLESLVPGYFAYANLRNHRKILVVDGKLGFTGGLNIREGAVLSLNPKYPLHDLHFRLVGPVVLHLQETFAEDWAFSTKEILTGELWYPPLEPAGEMLARGIRYGPDEDIGEMRLALAGALSCAETTRLHSHALISSPTIRLFRRSTSRRCAASMSTLSCRRRTICAPCNGPRTGCSGKFWNMAAVCFSRRRRSITPS